MRSLSLYGIAGAILGLWSALVLAAIGIPSYQDYLMPLAMYRDVTATAALANAAIQNLLPWIAIILGVWVWFMVAGQLNPVLALPWRAKEKRLWTWAAWIIGGLLFFVSCVSIGDIRFVVMADIDGDSHSVKWLVTPAAMAIAWLLVCPEAFGRFGKKRRAKLRWSAVGATAGFGALFALALSLITQAISAAFNIWFLVVTESLDRGMEPSMFGWTSLSIGMIVLYSLATAISFGLLKAFSPAAGKWRARLFAVRPALFLMGGALALAIIAFPLLRSIDYRNNAKLANAAELSNIQPLSLRLVKFCNDSKCRVSEGSSSPLKVGAPITHVPANGWLYPGGDVPLHPDTVTALQRFAGEKGKHSMLRKAAVMGSEEIFKTLWQPHDYYELSDRFTQQGAIKNGSLLTTQIQLAWLMRAAPINDKTRAMLERLSDDKKYFIGDRAAVRLAATWARFGDMQRAESFLTSAKQKSPGRFDNVVLTAGSLKNGRISGRIAVNGTTPSDIRVGLFRLTNDDPTRSDTPTNNKNKSPRNAKPAFTGTGISLLADSALLTTAGRFTFDHLSAGDYYLALLIPSSKLQDKNAVTTNNSPDVIELSVASRSRDMGLIRLTPR